MPQKVAKCVVFANHKGGSGKTTSCLSIAGFLAKSGNKVLIVDLDPQNSATTGLGIDSLSLRNSMYDAILDQCDGYEGVPIIRVILETKVENLHIAPSEFDLAVAEILMQHCRDRTGILNRILKEVRPLYDFILIDLSPSSGLLTINGLRASDYVVVPVDPSRLSLAALDSLKKSFDDIWRKTGHAVDRISVVLVRYVEPNVFADMFGRPNPSQATETELGKMFEKVFLVPESPEIYEAQKKGLPISHYAPKSRVAKAYQKIAQTVIQSLSE